MKKTTIKDLEKRIEKLESELANKPHNIKGEVCDNPELRDYYEKTFKGNVNTQPKYKVGDIVEYFTGSKLDTVKIKKVEYVGGQVNEYFYNDEILERYIGGYAKPDLLTQEEKEYLSAVIKPFRDKVISICLTMKGDEYIRIELNGYCNYFYIPVCRNENLHWKLPLNNLYTLEELGL